MGSEFLRTSYDFLHSSTHQRTHAQGIPSLASAGTLLLATNVP